jgi:signal peptidase I
MVERVVYRNGEALEEPYVDPTYEPNMALQRFGPSGYAWHLESGSDEIDPETYRPTRDTWGPLVVPEGQFLLLGDNRDQSLDSRFMGFIPREVIRGKAMFIYFSREPGRGIGGIRWSRIGDVIR